MNIFLVQTHHFSADILANLLIFLNKTKHLGTAKFQAFPSVLNVGYEELSTRCIPCQKLGQKFLLERNLLKEITRILPLLGKEDQYLQTDTFSRNSWYARIVPGETSTYLPELKKYTLEHLVNGMLRVSFLKQSFPLLKKGEEDEHRCQIDRQHDVYTGSQFLFEDCKLLREKHRLAKEDYLILLTNGNLDSNWVYMLDPAYENNIIINTCPLSELDSEKLPAALAFYLIKGLLAKQSYRSFIDWYLHLHPQSQSCLMDFNFKHQKAFKNIRSVGICRDCQSVINEQSVSPDLYRQLFSLLNDVRIELKGIF